jgi:hypothetical protein
METTPGAMDEDWDLLASFFPRQWREMARQTSALKGLRQDKGEENFLRTLLIHLGCGCSLRETAVRAREAQLAELSDVALLKRLRKSGDWLHHLCLALFEERGLDLSESAGTTLRLIDASVVKEPGPTGSLWRVHYCLDWPSLRCGFFQLTATEGEGTGESLCHFPLKAGEYLLADRGYSNATSIHYAAEQGAFLTVRLNPHGVRIEDEQGRRFDLLKRLAKVRKTQQVAVWAAQIPGRADQEAVRGRICVIRKSAAAIEQAKAKLRRKASKNGTVLQPDTLIYAEYVMVFTTFPADEFPGERVLEIYRIRWQIELVFKRFKQIAGLGHLPKHDEQSSKAWLYGKLFVALLTEKLMAQAESFSPWGYQMRKSQTAQPLA